MRRIALLGLMLCLLPGTNRAGEGPGRGPPTVDGRIGAAEWAGAERHRLHPDGDLLAREHEGTLYLGIRSGSAGLVSIGVAEGDGVRILHASASLGTAVYRREGDRWVRTRAFSWSCRRGGSEQERREHLEREGWIASTMGQGGPGEAEVAVRSSILGPSARLSVVHGSFGPQGIQVRSLPENLGSGAADEGLLRGEAPPDLGFAPARWLLLRKVAGERDGGAPR